MKIALFIPTSSLISANVMARLGNVISRPSRLDTNIGFVKPILAKYSVVT